MSENEQASKKRYGLFWVIITLLVGTNAFTLWLWIKEKNKVADQIVVTKEVIVERDNVKADLLALQKEYETLETSDEALKTEIEEKKLKIAELIQEAEKHKGDAYIISKLRKETETLRAIMKGYVRTIDSLGVLNQALVAEKKQVLKELDDEKTKGDELKREKEELKSTIAKGSILTCFNVSAKGVKFKSGGKKESETNRAKRVEKIKVQFSLGENKIAKAGEKTVYIRIMTPDGKEMAKGYDDNYRFTFGKSSGYFAGKETVNYANTEITAVTYCEGQGEFLPGNYQVEITCDGVVIGSGNFKLD
ncbi:MAG: hypothetical protein QM534_06250 [Sediminibacterium sp.]|nr:hypothetical protein [Sediminibacterium sp.]